jgi:hypothetical protein
MGTTMTTVADPTAKPRGRDKRGHGEGYIKQRPDGRTMAQVMVGRKPDGKKDVRTV